MGSESNKSDRPASYDAILEAAVAEFAERGRDGVRMEQVAVRAGLNKSLVYRHFENRDKLFEAALQSVFSKRFELLEDLPTELNGLFDLWTGRIASDPQFMKMLLRESLESDIEQPIHADLRSSYYAHQIKAMQKQQEQGQLPTDADAESLFLMLTAVLVFPYLLPQITKLVTGSSPHSVKFKRRWKKMFRVLVRQLETE
ncbi:TetR/AcrR family transcriptional regulator [Rubinisphaera italica]|uniref:HTH-type transcriptional repressor NicS n=1 Tax=Rubinisphaera italica TaxID=2527969 RepID=A0A5C5XN59_9PLAN|nr:TetR/AcrR family transcriptional regulator [Rubinisphaera italica]TWT64019.1 HTH-type transcriptional repressor NicS [Rubinisphaera italica]